MKIKHDLNFFEYPLWFQVSKAHENQMIWEDPKGYTYQAEYRAPDQLDMLFLMYICMRAQQDDYATKMDFSRYEILKGCGCPVNPQYLKRLEDSLNRWCRVRLSFKDCFYTGQNHTSGSFTLVDSFKIREKDKRLEINLASKFMQTTRNSAFFKYIHFDYYKMLRRPVSRRLYEILTHVFKTDPAWKLPLVDLGKRLTLYTRKKKDKHGNETQVIYPSDVLTSVKSAINEINSLATNIEVLRELGMDPKEIYAVTYEVDKRKTVEFTRVALNHLFDELTYEPDPRKKEGFEEPRLAELITYLKRTSRPLRELVTRYYKSHGYDYVKWNIFYANRNGAKNYVSYLKLCLQHNWAQELREEYERLFQTSGTPTLDERQISALVKVAEQADYLLLKEGKRFKIRRVFPNGAIEIVNRAYKMDFVISPTQAYSCRFETDSEKQKRKSLKR